MRASQSSRGAVDASSQATLGPLRWARWLKSVMNEAQTTNERKPGKTACKIHWHLR